MKYRLKSSLLLLRFLLSTRPSVLFKIIKKSREHLPKISTRVSRNGKFSGFANDYMFQAIHTQGSMEPYFHEIVNVLVNRNDIILDIGANIGAWALANESFVDRIISVEASPSTYLTLQDKCKDNEKITCVHTAIHNSPTGSVTFYECKTNTLSTTNKEWITNTTSRFGNYGIQNEITVKTTTLDSLIQTYGMPELIKIDVEGGEYEALLTLTQKVPLLCFEWAAELMNVASMCIGYLEKLGYTKFYIQTQDSYTFRPTTWQPARKIIAHLTIKIPKRDWGMIWASY